MHTQKNHCQFGKTICSVTRYDLNDACNITQFCGGVRCGIEAA